MKTKWMKEKAILEKLILEENRSYEEIGRKYGCSGSNIKKVSRKIGIILPERRKVNPKETFKRDRKYNICLNCGKEIPKPNKYCDINCYGEHRHKMSYNNFLEHPENYKSANYSPRNFKNEILKEQENKCAICGCSPEWNGKPLVFVLDHIDGHASNNCRSNLRLICPNCDSQTDTFKSRNKNGERSYYRYGYNRSAHRETGDVEDPLNDES